MADAPIPSFDHVIEEGIALQRHLPALDMVAVGGTAAALHAGHRYSTDVDHVTALPKEHQLAVTAQYHEAIAEWAQATDAYSSS